MSKFLLRIKNLTVDYRIQEGIIRVVDHVSLDIPKHMIVGLVGESGCGKTTLVQGIINLMPPNGYIKGGKIIFNNRNIFSLSNERQRQLRWQKIAVVFQAAQNSLNPVIKIKEQMLDTVLSHEKMSREEILKKSAKLIEFVRLDPSQILNSYPHQLSGGMRQRVLIAMGLLLDPELLILDEPTSALDTLSQAYFLELLEEIHKRLGITMLYVTHDLATMAKIADRMAIMYAGKIIEMGDVEQIFYNPQHPYTAGLIRSIPSVVGDVRKLRPIPGLPPSLLNKPKGCAFHPRCQYVADICKEIRPERKEIRRGNFVACHKFFKRYKRYFS